MDDNDEIKIQYQRREETLTDWEIIAEVIDDIPRSDLSNDELQAVFSFWWKRDEYNILVGERRTAGKKLHHLQHVECSDTDELALIRKQIRLPSVHTREMIESHPARHGRGAFLETMCFVVTSICFLLAFVKHYFATTKHFFLTLCFADVKIVS